MLVNRAVMGYRKLLFCWRISPSISSFVKLAWHTKQYAVSESRSSGTQKNEAIPYSLTLNNRRRVIFLRTYTGDIQIFYAVFWRLIYAFPLRIFSNAKTIIDLGAHIGMATLFFKLHAPKAIVYAVEADETNFKMLLKNLEPEIEEHQVIPIHAALAAENKTIYLERSQRSYNTRISKQETSLAVTGMNMDRLLSEYNITTIDILKVDIEGAETFLFAEAHAWIGKVQNIIIEIHSEEIMQQFTKLALVNHFQVKKLVAEHENVYWAFKPLS